MSCELLKDILQYIAVCISSIHRLWLSPSLLQMFFFSVSVLKCHSDSFSFYHYWFCISVEITRQKPKLTMIALRSHRKSIYLLILMASLSKTSCLLDLIRVRLIFTVFQWRLCTAHWFKLILTVIQHTDKNTQADDTGSTEWCHDLPQRVDFK